MKKLVSFYTLRSIILLFLITIPLQSFRYGPVVKIKEGTVATAHPLASEAAMEILHKGGNAVDAAVAAAFAIGVVEPDGSGLGGGGGMVIYLAKEKKSIYINYYQRASERINEIDFDPAKDKNSANSILVPGTVAGLTLALEKYGTLPLSEVLKPAIRYAKLGFPIDETLAKIILDNIYAVQKCPATTANFAPDGFPIIQGDTLRQPELASTLESISQYGRNGFYEGEIAQKIVDGITHNGGMITLNDLKNYKAVISKPVSGTYRGYQVLSADVPQSGASIIEALNILENENLTAMGNYSSNANTLHFVAETFRRVYSDRSAFLGDPAFANVPVKGLLSKDFAKERYSLINMSAALPKEYRKTETGNPFKFNDLTNNSSNNNNVIQADTKDDTWTDEENEGSSSYKKFANDKFDNWGKHNEKDKNKKYIKNEKIDTLKQKKNTDEDNLESSLFPVKDFEGGHTTHLCVIDRDGNAVALTQTLGNFFGSGFSVAGVLFNNSMSNFSSTSQINNVEPGKQPRSSIAPTIILKDGKPFMVVGSPGAGRIVATVVQLIVNVIDFGMNADDANKAPRFFCQKFDDYLHLENRFPESERIDLEKKGHHLKLYGDFDLYFGGAQLILRDPVTGDYHGSADPRRGGTAMGD
jgi:gamma-glutamyltranspeptidase / glutathione hydrolase